MIEVQRFRPDSRHDRGEQNSRLPTHFGLSVGWESSSTFLAMGRVPAKHALPTSDLLLIVCTVSGSPAGDSSRASSSPRGRDGDR